MFRDVSGSHVHRPVPLLSLNLSASTDKDKRSTGESGTEVRQIDTRLVYAELCAVAVKKKELLQPVNRAGEKPFLVIFNVLTTQRESRPCSKVLLSLRYLFGHLARPLDDDGLGLPDRCCCVLIVIT